MHEQRRGLETAFAPQSGGIVRRVDGAKAKTGMHSHVRDLRDICAVGRDGACLFEEK